LENTAKHSRFAYDQRENNRSEDVPLFGLFGRLDADKFPEPAAIPEFDYAGDFRKECIVFAQANIQAGLNSRTTLPDDNRTARN
jgi:hypothetical protein